MVEDGKVILEKVDTLQNLADALKKLMRTSKFKWYYEFVGLMGPSN